MHPALLLGRVLPPDEPGPARRRTRSSPDLQTLSFSPYAYVGVDPTPRRGARPRAALPAGYAPTPSVRPDPSRPPLAVVTGSAARVRRARPVATALLLCTGMAVIALVALAAGPASE